VSPSFSGWSPRRLFRTHLRAGGEAAEGFAASVGLEVERRRSLVVVEGLEEMAVVLAEEMRPHGAGGVAALGAVLDLDHLGAEVGEVHASRRGPRRIVLDGQDAQPASGRFMRDSARPAVWR
jgi:hypothetical protein